MLKRKHSNEYHQLLPHYEGKHEPKQNKNDFESARENKMKEDDKMVVKRHFERIFNMTMDFISYNKKEDFSENNEIFVYGSKHVKTEKFDNYILIGCESEEIFENDKLFNF